MKDFLLSVLAGLLSAFIYEKLPESKKFLNHLSIFAKKWRRALIISLVVTAIAFGSVIVVKYTIRRSKYSASWDTKTDGILNIYTPSNDGFLYSYALYLRDQNNSVSPEELGTWIERIPKGTTPIDFRWAFNKPGKYYVEIFKYDSIGENNTSSDENIRVCKSDEFAIETNSKIAPPNYVHYKNGVFQWNDVNNAAAYIVDVAYIRIDENGNKSIVRGVKLKTPSPQLDTYEENYREFFYSNNQVIIRIKSVSAFPKEYLNSDFSEEYEFSLEEIIPQDQPMG